nr:MnSOD [Alexandrium pacificum]
MVRRARCAPAAVPALAAAALALSRPGASFAVCGQSAAGRGCVARAGAAAAAPRGVRAAAERRGAAAFASVDTECFYAESIGGAGGAPRGIERDLITRFFGDGNELGEGDHAAALEALKQRMAQGDHFAGEDDGKGWIWLVADMHKTSGLQLELRKSTPLGKRPLLVAKQGNVDELFEKANWKLARHRLNEILGVRNASGQKV